MKNIKRDYKTYQTKRPLRPRYHSGQAHLHSTRHSGEAHLHDTDHSGEAHLHDTDHSGEAHLHDTDHSGEAYLHDTDHSGEAHLHDTDHSGEAHLHDTDHSGEAHLHDTDHSGEAHLHDTDHSGEAHLHDTGHILLGKEHGNTHIIRGSVVLEKDKENGVKTDYHINYSVGLQNVTGHTHVNDSYFYSGFRNYPQRGYLRFTTDNPRHRDQNHIVFINDKRHQTIRGEENRKVYFQIRKVPLVIGRNTVEIFVANNFDVVPHRPTFPQKREWKKSSDVFTSYSQGGQIDNGGSQPKVTLQELSHKNYDLNMNSNTVYARFISELPQKRQENFRLIQLKEEINTSYGFLKMRSDHTSYEDVILFISERSRIRKNKKVEFEIKTVPLLIAGNTIEMDVAYFKETFWLLRFILWTARGLKRLNPF